MAIFQCNHRSKVQGRSVNFNVIIPEQCEDDIPVCYMLHGINATPFDWIKSMSIERYATARSIAVVMPQADNSFYADMKYGFKFYTYIVEELIPYCRKLFHFSDKREKNFISGFSMGGYGCTKIAMRNPEMFAVCAPMSGVFSFYENFKKEVDIRAIPVWGDNVVEAVHNTEDDVYYLIDELVKSGKPKPWIYQCCGTEDGLIEDNRKMREFMKDKGFHYQYEEWAGAHTWDFWDEAIPKCLDVCKIYMKENGVEENLNGRFPGSIVKVEY